MFRYINGITVWGNDWVDEPEEKKPSDEGVYLVGVGLWELLLYKDSRCLAQPSYPKRHVVDLGPQAGM